MNLKCLPDALTVCKLTDLSRFSTDSDLFFLSRTDEELSLVCRTQETPDNTTAREDGWRGFRIEDVLDFSLIGILSRLTAVLAKQKIGVFAVSTYNTDYILVKAEQLAKAVLALQEAGYTVVS